jgi:hypothetical protein
VIHTLMRLVAVVGLAAVVVTVAGLAPDVAALADIDLVPPDRDSDPLLIPGVLAGIALGLAAFDNKRPVARVMAQADVLLHELAHIVVAAATGARPKGIVLRHDASGHATYMWSGRRNPLARLGKAAIAYVGYPGPAVLAAAGAVLFAQAGPRPVLAAAAVCGAVVALLARTPWTILVAAATTGAAVGALHDRAAPYAAGIVCLLLTAVAASATRRAVALAGERPLREGHDAHTVRDQIKLPARLVAVSQATVAVGASGWAVWAMASTLL